MGGLARMRDGRFSLFGFLLFLFAATSATAQAPKAAEAPAAKRPRVDVIELDNQIITPVTQGYIVEAIARAEGDGAACLVILLDTPGGLMESARAIVKHIMNSKIPVVVY